MAKPMTAFTTDLQHSGMIAKDLDETIKFYREVMGFELAGVSGSMASATSTSTAPTARPSNSARLWRSSGSDALDSRAICVSIVAAI